MRICAECAACCRSLIVEELSKPTNTKCRFQDIGCLVYHNRPKSCRGFDCAWKINMIGFESESMRPDRCGIVATPCSTDHGTGLALFEVWLDAAIDSRIQDIIIKYNKRYPIMIVPPSGNKGNLFDIHGALCE